MKTRRETRKGGRTSPHFVLRNRTEHLYYIRHRMRAEDFSEKKNPTLFSSFGFSASLHFKIKKHIQHPNMFLRKASC